MFFRQVTILWCVLIGYPMHLSAQDIDAMQEIVIDTKHDEYHARIEQALPHTVRLEEVTYDADLFFDPYEFTYLTGLRNGMDLTAIIVNKAIGYLIKKNKFQTIIIRIIEGEHGVRLHVKLISFWTMGALKFHGMLLNKDTYRQYYLMESGEPFDEHKHTLSLEKIKEAFIADGYVTPAITHRLDYDQATKSVTVHITLKPGDAFFIGQVGLVMRSHDDKVADYSGLKELIYKEFFKRIERARYSKKMLNAEMVALKRYLAKKGFLQVSIELQERVDMPARMIHLNFILDLHRKKEFVFKGNHFFSVDKLIDTILLFGESAALLPPAIVQQELEKAYKEKGFWDIAITADAREDAYCFSINEGRRASVKQLTFKKMEHYTAAALEKDYFSEFLRQKYYDAALCAKSVDALIAWYVGQGYLDAMIVHQEFVLLDALSNSYALELTLDEGVRSYLDTITLENFKELEDEGPFLAFRRSTEPVPFVMEYVQEQRRWLLNYFHDKGYVNVKVDPDFTRDENRIALVWKITTGESRGRFGKTIVLGSSNFPFHYVERELCYQQGQPWDAAKLRDSLVRLKELEIFETVHLHPYDNSLRGDDEQPIIIKLMQDDPFELRVRAGFAVQQVSKFLNTAGLTYRIGGAFFIKNPFNRADQICIQADVDRSQRAVLLQYRCPWILDKPIQTIIQGYDNKYQQPGLIGYKKNLYEIYQQGFLIAFMHRKNKIDTGCTVGIELMETTLQEDDQCVGKLLANQLARAINFAPSLLNQKIPYVQLEPTLLIDWLDQRLEPSKGLFTVLSLKGMFPFGPVGGNSYFVRLMAEQSFFIPFRPAVLGLRFRFGHIFNRLLNNIMPTERFYLGGANSIRSYETDRCPPLGLFIDDGNCPQYVPQGGRSMMNLNVEMRFPIAKNIGGVVFQDLGALSGDRLFDCLERPLLAGTGFGARYITPIGPLRFDIAWKWQRSYPGELPYAWFVSFSQAF